MHVLPALVRRLRVLVVLVLATALLPLGLASAAQSATSGAPAVAKESKKAGVPVGSTSANYPAGTLIVDLGATQTIAAGLKPYGFAYEMVTTYKVPIAWDIKNGKGAMGTSDFTATNLIDLSTNAPVASKTFSGSAFLVSGSFVGDIPAARITYWKGQGVKFYQATQPLTGLPEFSVLRSWPRIVLDAASSAVATKYYDNAGIPDSAYREALPSALTACDDLFVFPHADPTWALHNNLKAFNQSGGYIFGQCHAPSVLENIDDPGDAGTAPDLNFLSVDGLVPYGSHSDGTPPYTYNTDWSDPVLQVMNTIDAATENGSEQIYLPKSGGWRPSTKVLVWDPDHPQLIGGSGTDLSPGKAAVAAYGRGFGNSSNGLVMYQAGHDFAKSSGTANVAAQRTFLNFNLLAGIDRAVTVTSNVPTAPITAGDTIPVSATAIGGSGGYTYAWTSSCGGTFANSTAASTTFTAPSVASSTACTIRVTVTDSCGRVAFDAVSVPVNPPPPPAPSISLEKTVADGNDAGTDGQLGETLTYTFTVTNTGNLALHDVYIIDPVLGWPSPGQLCVASLLVGETKTCTKTYVVTKADVVAGSIHNTATASASPPTGGPVTATDDMTIATPAVPGLLITKSVVDGPDANSLADEGETLTYSFTVKNTGNVDLAPVTLTDPKLGLSGVTCVLNLDVGQTKSCDSTYPYVVTGTAPGEDISNGSVTNTVTATGTWPKPGGGGVVTAQGSSSITTFPSTSALVLDKTVADSNDADAVAGLGETLTYTFTVSNPGNQPLTNVMVADDMFLPNSPFLCVANLASGASASCTKNYVVTQADIVAGTIHNQAIASGKDPGNNTVSSPQDSAEIPAPALPAISLDKAVTDSADPFGLGGLGEMLTYTFTVTNTGNVPLTNVTLEDTKLWAGSVACFVGDLAVGETKTCSSVTYTVTSDDIVAGSVTNSATVTAEPTAGGGGPVHSTDSTSIPTVPPAGSITLDKTVADSPIDADSIASLGEELTYTFTVTNTGNVPLSNVKITDAKLGLTNEPCVASLDVGDTAVCAIAATYTVASVDITAHSVDNEATVNATAPPGSSPVTNKDSASIPTDNPMITMTKSVAEADPSDLLATEGEQLSYSFTVTNTGNVDLTDVKITDTKLGLSNADCVASLPIGQTTSCPLLVTPTYTVTATDVGNHKVDNTATATASSPSGPATAEASASVPAGVVAPDLSIDKTVDVSQAVPGQTVTYTIKVRNTGTGPATDVVVTDPLPAGTSFVSATAPCTHAAGTVTCSLGSVPAGATVTLTLKVKLDPATDASSDHQHHLDYTKVETHLSVFDTDTTGTVQCPSGYVATDGGVRLDSVDQGGSFASVHVLASAVTPDGKGWTATVRNDNDGQAQAKVNVVCMTEETTSGEDHTHAVVITGPVATTQALAPGHNEIDLACAAGSYPVQPSYVLSGGTAAVGSRRTAGGWRFVVEADSATSGTFAIHCLSKTLGTTAGHDHELLFEQLTDTVSVPPGAVVERKLTCPDGYKGIVAWADLDPGLVSLGNDPQPITRVFKFYNPTGSALDADFGLLCVSIRTKGGSAPNADVTNTASLTSPSSDPTPGDHTDSATFTLNPTGVIVAPRAVVVTKAGRTQVRLSVTTTGRRSVTMKLVAAGKVGGTRIKAGSVLAQRRTTLGKGKATVRLTARGSAGQVLRSGRVDRAKLVVISRGHKSVRIIRLHR